MNTHPFDIPVYPSYDTIQPMYPLHNDQSKQPIQPIQPIQPDVEQLEEMRLAAYKEICDRHEINPTFASKMRILEGFKIVIVCDDSGSMNEIANSGFTGNNPYGKKPTRWDELKITVGMIIDIAATLSPNGVDIYFLNRDGLLNVTNRDQIKQFFVNKPTGGTPIVATLRKIYNHKIDHKRLVVLATDGCPTNSAGNSDIASFKNVLRNERGSRDYMTIIACTDDDSTMAYLNNWDKRIPRLDVVDDYGNEKHEILNVQGHNFPFSYGDYVVKCLLGSIDPWFDSLDEVRIGSYNSNKNGEHNHGCRCQLF